MKIKKIITIILLVICLANLSIVYADDETEEIEEITKETIETSTDVTGEPKIDSRVAVIYDRLSKRVLYGKNETKQVPMASTTKIMTAIVVLEKANLNEQIEIEQQAASVGGSRLGLKKGDKITIRDLLYRINVKIRK